MGNWSGPWRWTAGSSPPLRRARDDRGRHHANRPTSRDLRLLHPHVLPRRPSRPRRHPLQVEDCPWPGKIAWATAKDPWAPWRADANRVGPSAWSLHALRPLDPAPGCPGRLVLRRRRLRLAAVVPQIDAFNVPMFLLIMPMFALSETFFPCPPRDGCGRSAASAPSPRSPGSPARPPWLALAPRTVPALLALAAGAAGLHAPGPETHAQVAHPERRAPPGPQGPDPSLNIGGPARHVLYLADGMREDWRPSWSAGRRTRTRNGRPGRFPQGDPLRIQRLRRGIRPLDDLLAFVSPSGGSAGSSRPASSTRTRKQGRGPRPAGGPTRGRPRRPPYLPRPRLPGLFPRLEVPAGRPGREAPGLPLDANHAVSSQRTNLVTLGVCPADRIGTLIPLGLDLVLAPPPSAGRPARDRLRGPSLVPIKGHACPGAFAKLRTEGPARPDRRRERGRAWRRARQSRSVSQRWKRDLREVYGGWTSACWPRSAELARDPDRGRGRRCPSSRRSGACRTSFRASGGDPGRAFGSGGGAGEGAGGRSRIWRTWKARRGEASAIWQARYDRGRLCGGPPREYAQLRA